MTIALWCVSIAAMLPYVAVLLVKGRDNESPRASEAKLTGRDARLVGAQLNAFEAFPFFAFSVLAAHVVKGPSHVVDALALLFLAARVAHMTAYAAGKGSLRSAMFSLGFLAVIAIFVWGAL